MKKAITILFSLIMAMCLVACGNSAGRAEHSSTGNNSTESGTRNDAENSAGDPAQAESGAEGGAQTEDKLEDDAQAEGRAEDGVQTQGSGTQTETEIPETHGSKVLVAYFSATNTTEGVAEHIANGLNADLYEIIPEDPYTDADLNYNDNNSRSTIEMNDPSSRPAISGSVENMGQYDIVFIGYPIWWGEAPRIVSTFVESYDFSGKTVVPFCTSGGSGIANSVSNIRGLANGATWLDGRRFGGTSRDAIIEWVNSLNLGAAAN